MDPIRVGIVSSGSQQLRTARARVPVTTCKATVMETLKGAVDSLEKP